MGIGLMVVSRDFRGVGVQQERRRERRRGMESVRSRESLRIDCDNRVRGR